MGHLEKNWSNWFSGGLLGQQLIRYLVLVQLGALVIMLLSQVLISWPVRMEQDEIIQLGRISGALQQLQIAMDDQETGLRGYELTRDVHFLAPFQTGSAHFSHTTAQLMTINHPASIKPFVDQAVQIGRQWHNEYALPMINSVAHDARVHFTTLDNAKHQFDRFRKAYSLVLLKVDNLIHVDSIRLKVLSVVSILIYALIAIAAMTLVTILLSRQLRKWVEPIITLTRAVDRYSKGDLHHPAPSYQDHTELGRLFTGVETMRVALLKQFRSMENMALQDGLTGIWNRRYLDERLALDVRDAIVSVNHRFCVFMCDIDYFKAINDTYGHQEGDRVLREVAERIQQNIRKGDVLARYGGEEFVIISYTDNRHALDYAERLRLSVRFVTVQDQRVSVSIGVAEYKQGETPKDILKRADDALYQAKQNGRNRVNFIA